MIDDSLKMAIAELETALTSATPNMPTLLRQIHTALKQQPGQVTLLSEEDILTIVKGLERQTGVALLAGQKKKKVTGKNVTIDML